MKKKYEKLVPFSILARAAMTLLLMLITTATAWAQGTGTLGNPYKISNYAELRQFANIVNGAGGGEANTSAYAQLEDDIVCKIDPSDPDYATDWTPIGNGTHPYTGTFDGKGHTITGLSTPNDYDSNYVGLFGDVGNGGIVKDVIIVDAKIRGRNYVGGAVGASGGGIIRNVVVSNSEITGTSHVGGVVGYNLNGSVQTSCLIGSSSVGGSSTNSYYGGIMGNNNGTIQN